MHAGHAAQRQRFGTQLRHAQLGTQLSPEAGSARSFKTQPRHATAQHAEPGAQMARKRALGSVLGA
eukprot:7590277-Alexandrium_andersonii.AAC.1